ncbi:phosphoglucomutase [Desulfobulbus alkaliphilus]|uniref:phosphoglucomutase n=1 Tax=Desulfobulbus alkaliphilus TaxID=869814 RepID=UPI00196237D3|nr:phosphoglucomutase [Desulfobulbus alkaliphilus]MBM9537962.1 phosphoglucomutase [Desulfobulbus alkaliphilus]
MMIKSEIDRILQQHIVAHNHRDSNYFAALQLLVDERNRAADEATRTQWQAGIDHVYTLVADELLTNPDPPLRAITFGTSGWRGILGKDISIRSVAVVTTAILSLYREAEKDPALRAALGIADFATMQHRGCVVGHDNRFGGSLLAQAVINILSANGVRVYYAGEATTGALSAAVLVRKAAFSVNLTPSHNPMEYGGFKYNAADAGPAAPILTDAITKRARDFILRSDNPFMPPDIDLQQSLNDRPEIIAEDALQSWQQLVRNGTPLHGLEYDRILETFAASSDVVLCIDAVHGAARQYLRRLLNNPPEERLVLLRNKPDPTFGGIAPEPSSVNMQPVMSALAARREPLRIGAIIDPDGDRIRFTDGRIEISMNQFGAMAYHFLHEIKKKKGMVAKTVASSNLANALAAQLAEDVFEPKVGFKEFKPVLNKALVCFEESDGISIIGHTPEKDAFIGLILALDMVLTMKKSLGEYLFEIEEQFGHYYPDRDGVAVSRQGKELLQALDKLKKYTPGSQVAVGDAMKTITKVIDIDGRKMILDDGSWIMIRPSGTEPKVRFYVEARTSSETAQLVSSAKSMLAEIGLLP